MTAVFRIAPDPDLAPHGLGLLLPSREWRKMWRRHAEFGEPARGHRGLLDDLHNFAKRGAIGRYCVTLDAG